LKATERIATWCAVRIGGVKKHAPQLRMTVARSSAVQEGMSQAIEMHLAALREDGDEIPEPSRLELGEAA
jgi:hypothetical protein